MPVIQNFLKPLISNPQSHIMHIISVAKDVVDIVATEVSMLHHPWHTWIHKLQYWLLPVLLYMFSLLCAVQISYLHTMSSAMTFMAHV